MITKLPMYDAIRSRCGQMGPGTQAFLKSLSVVSLCFAFSKVFSSVAAVIVANYLGPISFGEAQVVLLVAQVLPLFMLFGLHVAIMRYGAAKENPAPVVATAVYISGLMVILTTAAAWLLRDYVAPSLRLSPYKYNWAIKLGVLFSAYAMFSSIYQVLNQFKQRGVIEVAMAFLLLPGLATGHLLTGGGYETLLIAYAIAYLFCLPPMVWRFRHLMSPRFLFAPETREMLTYGGLVFFSNTGYILTFVIQPLQLQRAHGEGQVGLFRLYSLGSLLLATFATTVFYTVFFPKVSVSQDRIGIWHRLTKAWVRGALPLFLMFTVIQTVIVLLAGKEFPLIWTQVLLFALASTLITSQATYGQIIAAQGVLGMRWGLVLSLVSGGTNFLLSILLIPNYGATGAIVALIANYTITLLGTLALRDAVLKVPPASDQPDTDFSA